LINKSYNTKIEKSGNVCGTRTWQLAQGGDTKDAAHAGYDPSV
jgi:hypothetical protein